MNWIISFILSIAFIGAGIVLLAIMRKNNFSVGGLITPFNALFVGAILASYVLSLPVNLFTLAGEQFGVFKASLISLHNVFQMFSMDAGYGDLAEIVGQAVAIGDISAEFAPYYLAYSSILFVADPILTFGFILLLFKHLFAYFKYLFSYSKDVYVFSELNPKSLVLAKDIKKNHPKALIVYTDVFDGEDELSFELIESAKKLKALTFRKDIAAVNFDQHSKKAEIFFFAIGKDETENTNQALALIKKYKDRENTNLYVFCSNIVGALILATPMEMKMRVRRIDEAHSLVSRQLYENGYSFFENALPIENSSDKQISAVVVGMGAYGTEMIRSLAWFCQMDGYKIKINGFDKDPDALKKLSAICPELMDDEHNGTEVFTEAQYDIKIHSGISVGTTSFTDKINEIKDATYVLVCIGNDELNIETAITLRTLFERMGISPKIQAVVHNDMLKGLLTGVTNFRGQAYDVEFIGDDESSYTEDVIIDNELEMDALSRHKKYGKEEDFWKYEYNYHSSVASAIHLKARIACKIPGADKSEDELTPEEADIIEVLEHRRWNAYMRSIGYVYSGDPDSKTRNDLAKKHHNLTPFKILSEEDKRKDRRVGTK